MMSDDKPEQYYVPSDDATVLSAELFWIGLSLICFSVYFLLRYRFPEFIILRELPKRVQSANSTFNKIVETLRLTESELIAQVGYDVYLTIRLIRFCLKLCIRFAWGGVFFLAPIYFQQPQSEKCKQYCKYDRGKGRETDDDDKLNKYRSECVCGFIDSCSIANIPTEDSPASWFALWIICYVSVVAIYELRKEYKEIVRIRKNLFLSRPARMHTVFIDRIPRALSKPGALRDYFEKLFPNQVLDVQILVRISALLKVSQERYTILKNLERAIARRNLDGVEAKHLVLSSKSSPSSSTASFCFCVRQANSIEFYAALLEQANVRFERIKRDTFLESKKHEDHSDDEEDQLEENVSPRQAFVTFKTVEPVSILSQMVVEDNLRAKLAPDPEDVRWETLGERNTAFSHFVRKVFSRVFFLFLLLFWGALTSFVGAVTSTEALARQFPTLNTFLISNPSLVQWMDRITTLVYIVLIAIVQPLITLSVKMEVRISNSNVERASSERFFLFLVVQVFVFYSIAGSVFKSVVDVAESPTKLFTTLATTIPKNASFFISFISVKCFWLFFDLMRGYAFIFSVLRYLMMGKTITRREFRTPFCGCCFHFQFPSPLGLSGANANILLVFFISTSYVTVQPLLILAGVFYFLSAALVFPLVTVSSSKQVYDGGGASWTHNYWCIVGAIVTSQFTLIGVLLTKQAFSAAFWGLCLSALFIGASFHVHSKYRSLSTEISFETANYLDREDGGNDEEIKVLNPTKILHGEVFEREKDEGEMELEEEQAERVVVKKKHPIKVWKYMNPVLFQNSFEAPELESTMVANDFGYASNGDLAYARMLDLNLTNTPRPVINKKTRGGGEQSD